MKHIANVMSFEDLNTEQEATVGRIYKSGKVYIIKTVCGLKLTARDHATACSTGLKLGDTCFIRPL